MDRSHTGTACIVPSFCNTPFFRKKDLYAVKWEDYTELLKELKATRDAHYAMECSTMFLCEEMMRGEGVLQNGVERISVPESDARNGIVRSNVNLKNYMLTVGSTGWVMDTMNGNSVHFCNQSSETNSEYITVTPDCSTIEVVFVAALVDLPARREATVGYASGAYDDTPSIVCQCDTP